MKTVHIKDSLKFGWKTVTENAWYFVGLTFVLWAIPEVLRMLGAVGSGHGFSNANYMRMGMGGGAINSQIGITGGIFMLLSIIASAVLYAGYIRIILAWTDGKRPEFKELFYFGPHLLPFIGASILFGILVGVGTLFFIVPGLILMTIFLFYSFCIFDQNAGVIESFKKSADITKGARWDLFLFLLVTAGISILGAIPFGLGLLITMPLTLLAAARVYRSLLTQMTPAVAVSVAPAAPATPDAPAQTPPVTPTTV